VPIVTRGTKYDRGVRGEESAVAYQDLTDAETAFGNQQLSSSGATVKVSRRETFNAAHQLYDPARSDEENERLFGKCRHLHGHNYVLEVVVSGEIQGGTGYVIDLKHLSDVIHRRVIQDVDHRNLNTDVPWLRGLIPTAENLALAFWERIRSELPEGKLSSLRLWETDKNWAEVGDHV
jgi:6-pyruvoyltetrahydropterin/6-carboxytetrahydropterin synthase